ncbi:LysR family transcriptional regulator [Paracidovorax anthurii]|uniref:DNA-binding transcriptional LysR family regulator n=1 Tax=Paracidovorax anthurii TaxID=78229 RepID=A0A328Z8S1_9BURK|nr:LysR family transcriptional regulator [Paracidovorax anthurii]RAR82590.1 DNA-binding transcriptional LysR family regulator [Paracidovorax anthurii]WCM95337.1 LysR family transcriptional regulator [Acidovorax sp. NCPPB 2350]
MEIRQLEAFAAVMSAGSVTAAARLLSRSQPAITRLVQELEAEIGYALFERNGPRVTPTEQGFLLYDDVERALGGLRHIHERAAEIARGGGVAPLVLAATSALAVGLLPQALGGVEARFGAGALRLRSASPEQVVHAVVSGTVQLGASSLPLEHRGLQVLWIGEVPCVAVLPAGDPLARHAVVPMAALAERRLITMSNPYRLRQRLDAGLPAGAAGEGGAREALIETNASINAQALVRAGLGVAVLEPLTARAAPDDGLAVRPLDVHIPFFFGVVVPQARPPTAHVTAVADALLEAARAVPGFVQHDVGAHAQLLQARTPHEEQPARAARKVSR